MPLPPDARPRWEKLTKLLDCAQRRGVESLTVEEVKQVCRLYRHVTIDLSRTRTDGADPELLNYLNFLAARAHGCVYRARRVNIRGLFSFVGSGFPRLVRRWAWPILIATALFLGTALASFLAVIHQPELAYSLFDERVVEYENLREALGWPFPRSAGQPQPGADEVSLGRARLERWAHLMEWVVSLT